MKKLIYRYFINDRYSCIEEACSEYDYVGCFLDSFGTSKALRAKVHKPKDEEEAQKLDEMYEFAVEYHNKSVNEPETFMSFIDDMRHYIVAGYYEFKWYLKGFKEIIFR
ncbi:MAG: hypothetical protein OXC79_03145 [Candidatus Poribacteria bacterium]|nr:hypothetical protein [Candidatus Poribacteria bacterium]